MPKIAIIILNWNQPQLTINTIDSIFKITHPSFAYQIILVDNCSTDDSVNVLKQKFADKIIILQTKTNLGYSGGNNFGINYAIQNNYDYILIANNDIRVDSLFLEKLFQSIKNNPHSMLAPKIYFEKGYEYFKDKYQDSELGKVIWALGGKIDWNNIYGSNFAIDIVDHGQFDKQKLSPDFISGCCFLVESSFFKKVGMFDDKYYLYMEDVDLSVRAKKHHYNLSIVPQSLIWHINSGTTGKASNFQDYFITRNRLLFAQKYCNLKTKFALFRESIKLLLSGRKWQKRGIIDYYLSNFEQGSWQK